MKNYAPKKKSEQSENANVKDEKDLFNATKNDDGDLTEDKLLDELDLPDDNDMPTQRIHVIDPLIESEPIVKDYSTPDVIGDIENAPEIPEDIIERPTVDLTKDNTATIENEQSFKAKPVAKDGENTFFGGSKDSDNAQSQYSSPPPSSSKEKKESTMGNPDLDEYSKKVQKEASKHLAETVVDGYEMVHELVKGYLLKTDEKLIKQALKGKIELDAIDSEIQIGGKVYQIRRLLHDYNMNIEQVLSVSPEFRQQVLPLLQEEFARRNMGLTPMQRILALVIKDLQPKIVQVTQLVGTMNNVLKQQSAIIKQQAEVIRNSKSQRVEEPIIIEHNNYEPEESNSGSSQ